MLSQRCLLCSPGLHRGQQGPLLVPLREAPVFQGNDLGAHHCWDPLLPMSLLCLEVWKEFRHTSRRQGQEWARYPQAPRHMWQSQQEIELPPLPPKEGKGPTDTPACSHLWGLITTFALPGHWLLRHSVESAGPGSACLVPGGTLSSEVGVFSSATRPGVWAQKRSAACLSYGENETQQTEGWEWGQGSGASELPPGPAVSGSASFREGGNAEKF